MHHPDHNAPPFNPVPNVVWLLVVLIAGPEVLFQLAEAGFMGVSKIGLRSEAVSQFAAFDQVFEWMRETGNIPIWGLYPYVTLGFVNSGFVDAIFAIVMILAIGNMVARVLHPIAFLAVFFGGCAFGALFYHLIDNAQYPAMGAFTGVYGLLGAFAWINFMVLGHAGEDRTQAFYLITFLMGIQLLFNMIGGGPNTWISDLGAFIYGFFICWIIAPGALRALMSRFRRR